MTSEQVITRHPRDYTVQIRHTTTNAIVGTGVIVSSEGKIVTCAHVVAAAGVNPRLGRRIPNSWEMVLQGLFGRKAEPLMEGRDAEVGICFPEWRGRRREERRAKVVSWFSEYEDDVVVLQLVDGPAPVRPEQIAKLGTAEDSEGNHFRSYGYSPTGENPGTWAEGTIEGSVERTPESQLQADLIQLTSRNIDDGMSGAGVLDTTRNLVVGIIAERYDPGKSAVKDELGYAVDSCILTFNPLNLPVQSEDIPLEEVSQTGIDIATARAAVVATPGNVFHGAPAPLQEWVGRQDLLQALNTDWVDPACRVSELIGFGGEGKSSLARQWLDQLLHDPSPPQPEGVFWWNCYDNRSVDALFEAALQYLSGGSVNPRDYPSTFARAHFIAGMLTKGRFLFILDGLEVLQHSEGDSYGLLVNTDLRELLSHFADPRHNSFCLLTSRAPVIDLLNYTTFHHHDVERLSPKDGRDMLRKLGITGPDAALDKVVKDWDGHALTLSLLGGYLVERYVGDIAQIGNLPAPTANETHYDRVQRVLRRYDTHLSEAERAFLLLFSAFRLPVPENALAPVFRTKTEDAASDLTAPLTALDDQNFEALLKRLRTYHLLTYDVQTQRYTTHPLIRAYYAARLSEQERSQMQTVHARIKDYYLSIAGDTPRHPTMSELVPLIEAVHHACGAGGYDAALIALYWHRISNVLLDELGAYETALRLLQDFFPGGDTGQEPFLRTSLTISYFVGVVGFCLMNLGRLAEAAPFYERSIVMYLERQGWSAASVGYLNVAELNIYRGILAASAQATLKALTLARQAQNKQDECNSLVHQAWTAHLQGDFQEAGAAFQQAKALEQEIDPQKRYLYSLRGIRHAEHLRRVGQEDYARRITEANLGLCRQYRWTNSLSRCHRMLGDLAAYTGEYQYAQQQYDEALTLAWSISQRDILIEALLAQGRFAARQGDGEIARTYLEDAMGYAVTSGYRLYEVDIAIALAWAYSAMGDEPTARAQAERALRLSTEMEYYWGQVDAKEVLTALNGVGS